MSHAKKAENRYAAILEKIFCDGHRKGVTEIPFAREDLTRAATALGIELPKNLGDVLYSVRYRTAMPQAVTRTQPPGQEWTIQGRGKARYVFRLAPINRIAPNPQLAPIKIPDATPEIVAAYALSDEQALLAKVRYNRLIDVFLGVAAYPLQNHLRTTVEGVGQVEIDEIYVAVDKRGRQFIVPVQAKGGSDQLSSVQTEQDLACCAQKYPQLICRAISAQFLDNQLIALFELAGTAEGIRIIEEKHYRLVPASEVTAADLAQYSH